MRIIPSALFLIFALVACGDDDSENMRDAPANDVTSDAAEDDAGSDVGSDVTLDTTSDVPTDTSSDTSGDAGYQGSSGCTTGSGLSEGEHTFELDERNRRYILRLPQGYDASRAYPVVFALHGNGGNTGYWDGDSGSRNIRGELGNDAILVVAEAIDNQWRDYSMDRETWPARIDQELAYFDRIINDISNELCVDERALFAMGFSGGGSFSGVLGCRRTDIRAIAVGGSVIYFDQNDCVGTPAAWITIGQEEFTPARETYRNFFRDRAGCDATTTPTEPSPCVAYDSCGADTPVHYCEHPGGHVWPGFGVAASWAFFEQFVE